MRDDWRYRGVATWQLEQLTAYNPEAQMIARLDKEDDGDMYIPEDFWRVVQSVLKEKEYKVVWARLADHKTYADIGAEHGVSRQRAHQIYNEAIEVLKPVLKEWIALRPKAVQMNQYLRNSV